MVPLFGEGRVYVQYFMGTTCSAGEGGISTGIY